MPLHLAATAHGAKQLAALCEHWMATDLALSMRNEQWKELDEAAVGRVRAEHERLQAARAARREERVLMEKLPCLLAPIVTSATATRP